MYLRPGETTMRDLLLILVLFVVRVEPIERIELFKIYKSVPIMRTGRILQRDLSGDKAFMVYLRPVPFGVNLTPLTEWVCGGVIIHKLHILTSAVCIENTTHFLVISGTHKWIPPEVDDNKCIKNGAKKAIWKGTPNGIFYDGGNIDNVRWIVGDIAVVKVEDEFNFERKIQGCDFIPKKMVINKFGMEFEKSGTSAFIVGWGSTKRYTNINPVSAVNLLETNVVILTRADCKEFWNERYRNDINEEIICVQDTETPGNDCTETNGKCKTTTNSKEKYFDRKSGQMERRINTGIRIPYDVLHNDVVKGGSNGGFCENDHGGPLLVGKGKNAIVTGIMSACFNKNTTNKCSGPFFFTSVYKYQDLIIACGLMSVTGPECRRLIKSRKYAETFFNWTGHPEGPAISETSNSINHRIYVQTPREPQWPPAATSKHTTSEESLTSREPPSRQFIVLNNSLSEFNESSLMQQNVSTTQPENKLPAYFNKTRILTTSQYSKKPLRYDYSQFDVSELKYFKHTTEYDPYIQIFETYTINDDSYLPEPDMNTPKYDKYSSKPSKFTLEFVEHSTKYRPKHHKSTLIFDMYTTQEDMFSSKSHTHNPKHDTSTSKTRIYTSKFHMSSSKSHKHTATQDMSTSKSHKHTLKSHMSTSISYKPTTIFNLYTPEFHNSTPEQADPLDSQNKIFDLLTVELWNVHNFRSKPKYKIRHPQNSIFVNKSIYLKKVEGRLNNSSLD